MNENIQESKVDILQKTEQALAELSIAGSAAGGIVPETGSALTTDLLCGIPSISPRSHPRSGVSRMISSQFSRIALSHLDLPAAIGSSPRTRVCFRLARLMVFLVGPIHCRDIIMGIRSRSQAVTHIDTITGTVPESMITSA